MTVRKALLIGNSKYDESHRFLPLQAPHNDIDMLEILLLHPQIGSFDSVEIIRDGRIKEATKQIKDFFINSQSTDFLIFYFSGHAFFYADNGDDKQEYFLAFSDTDTDVAELTTVQKSQLLKYMKTSPARKLVVLDCCFSANITPDTKVIMTPTLNVPLPATNISHREFFLSSSAESQYSWDGKKAHKPKNSKSLVNSLFTHHLIEALRTGLGDQDKDGKITIQELYNYVNSKVKEESNKAQIPVLSPNINDKDFIIAKNEEFLISIVAAELNGDVIQATTHVIYDSRDSNDHLQLGQEPFEITLKTLHQLPSENEFYLVLLKENLLPPYGKMLVDVAKIQTLDYSFNISINRNDINDKFIISIHGEDESQTHTRILSINNISFEKLLKRSVKVNPLVSADVLFILDGTMRQDNLTLGKSMIWHMMHELHKQGFPVRFGILLYGEYQYMYNDNSVPFQNIEGTDMPFTLRANRFSRHLDELEKFIQTIDAQHDFLGQDTANALEYAIHQSHQKMKWESDKKYTILIGNSPPHPKEDERKEKGLLYWSSDDFLEIDWQDEIQKLQTFCDHTFGIWVKPKSPLTDSDIRYCKVVWQEFDARNQWVEISDEQSAEQAFDNVMNTIIDKHKPIFSGKLEIPLLEKFMMTGA